MEFPDTLCFPLTNCYLMKLLACGAKLMLTKKNLLGIIFLPSSQRGACQCSHSPMIPHFIRLGFGLASR